MQTHRLRKHADYQTVYRSGRKQFSKQIAYFHVLRPAMLPNGTPTGADTSGPRVGLTVPKALGKAVDRNRIKRRLREAVRRELPRVHAAVDIILHPRRSVIDLDFAVLQREVAQIFRSVQGACDRTQGSSPQP